MRQVFSVTYTIYDQCDGTIMTDTDTKVIAVKDKKQIDVTIARYHDIYAAWLTGDYAILIHDCHLLRYDQ